jgi:hypothetical protein
MVVPEVRRRVKAILRPAASPLLWRLRLPFDLMLPRIELLEQRLASIAAPAPSGSALRETVDSLTRVWLRLQNEVARLTSSVPEAAASAAQARIAEFEVRLQNEVARLTSSLPEAAASAAQARIAELEVRLQAAEHRWQDDVEGRGRRVDDTLRFLLDRVEFVRREMMFELRYGAGGGTAGLAGPAALRPRILVPEKVEAAQASGALRLNIGCGHIPEAGYINIDMRDLPGVDVVAEAGDLPFDPGSVDEISSAHLVEHFPQEEMRRRLLPYWCHMLKPGGRLRMVTPDGEAMLAGLAQGSCTFEDLREVLFGGQEYEGDFHYNLFTSDSLSRMVKEAGFTAVEVPVRGRRNGQCFEFELVAQVPSATSRQ